MLNKGDMIELEGSDDKYVVVKYFQDQGRFFVILARDDEPTILKFCFLDQDKIKEINDPKLIEYLTKVSKEK